MNATWRFVLQLAIPALADVIVALIERLNAADTPLSAVEVSYRIVKGIDLMHPDLLTATKREMAREAIAAHIERNGGKPTDSNVRALLELAVQKWKAEQAG